MYRAGEFRTGCTPAHAFGDGELAQRVVDHVENHVAGFDTGNDLAQAKALALGRAEDFEGLGFHTLARGETGGGLAPVAVAIASLGDGRPQGLLALILGLFCEVADAQGEAAGSCKPFDVPEAEAQCPQFRWQ